MAINEIRLIRIKDIVGYFYKPKIYSGKSIIYAKGGPSFADTGDSPLWPIARRRKFALFIPDYKGYCRSFGKFNFKNCIETINESEGFLRGKLNATDISTGETISNNSNEVILVGSSWGGAIVPFLEKYQTSAINTIVLIKPVTDWATQGKVKYKEEDVEQTYKFIKLGWENVYRGFNDSEWPGIFQGKHTEFNPIDNIELLKDKEVFIFHGKKDKTINWRKSLTYFKKFKSLYPESNVNLMLSDTGHGSDTTIQGLSRVLKTLSRKKRATNRATIWPVQKD